MGPALRRENGLECARWRPTATALSTYRTRGASAPTGRGGPTPNYTRVIASVEGRNDLEMDQNISQILALT